MGLQKKIREHIKTDSNNIGKISHLILGGLVKYYKCVTLNNGHIQPNIIRL